MAQKIRYHLILSYDGTDFYGWQKQPTKRTVQGVLCSVLSELLSQRIKVVGASRTDSGVHAFCQWATFDAQTDWVPERLKNALNRVLPDDIAVIDARIVSPEFNARFSAVAKQYEYRILFEKDPFRTRYSILWRWKERPDLVRLNRISEIFIGKYNFSAFGIKRDLRENCSCTIFHSEWFEIERGIKFVILGDRFLHKMVRAVVGSVIDCYRGKIAYENIAEMLESGEKTANFHIVPAKGLCLAKIFGEGDKIEIERHNIDFFESRG